MKTQKQTTGGDLRFERFAVREAVGVETDNLRELRASEADRRTLRQAEKKVSQAKKKLRRVY